MKEQRIIKIIGLCLVIALIGLILDLTKVYESLGYFMLNLGLLIGEIMGLIILIRHSTLTKTRYWKVTQFSIGIVLIGMMFKILHLPGANLVLIAAVLAIGQTYTVRFIKKPLKKRLDILKWLWLIGASIVASLILLNLISKEWIFLVTGLFWLIFLDFLITDLRPTWIKRR